MLPGLLRNYVSPGTEPKKRIENAYVYKVRSQLRSQEPPVVHLEQERRSTSTTPTIPIPTNPN